MKKETLLDAGVSEEAVQKVLDLINSEISGNYVPLSRFAQVNEQKNELNKQINELQKSNAGIDDLKQQIADFQKRNLEQEKAYKAELEGIKLNGYVEKVLTEAKAKNILAVKGLLNDFLKNAKLDKNDTVEGLKEQVEALKAGKDTAFLFEASTPKPSFNGTTPKENTSKTEGGQTQSRSDFSTALQNVIARQMEN